MQKPSTIDVWVYQPTVCTEATEPLLHMLSSDEQISAKNLRKRDGYIKEKAALRRILSSYLGEAPHQIKLNKTAEGKPFIEGEPLQFSVSHSQNLWVCAVGYTDSLGVDIEYVKRARDLSGIATRYFHPDESAAFQLLGEAKQPSYFYSRWTLKEAFLKALGCGIAGGLHHINIKTAEQTSRATLSATLLEAHERHKTPWHFYYQRLSHHTHFSVVYQSTGKQTVVYKNFSFANKP